MTSFILDWTNQRVLLWKRIAKKVQEIWLIWKKIKETKQHLVTFYSHYKTSHQLVLYEDAHTWVGTTHCTHHIWSCYPKSLASYIYKKHQCQHWKVHSEEHLISWDSLSTLMSTQRGCALYCCLVVIYFSWDDLLCLCFLTLLGMRDILFCNTTKQWWEP